MQGVSQPKNDGFSLSSGDFPTLGSDKDKSALNSELQGIIILYNHYGVYLLNCIPIILLLTMQCYFFIFFLGDEAVQYYIVMVVIVSLNYNTCIYHLGVATIFTMVLTKVLGVLCLNNDINYSS